MGPPRPRLLEPTAAAIPVRRRAREKGREVQAAVADRREHAGFYRLVEIQFAAMALVEYDPVDVLDMQVDDDKRTYREYSRSEFGSHRPPTFTIYSTGKAPDRAIT